MAELQCPVCGQLNPDHFETCRYCQADLAALASGAEESGSGRSEGDLADWLLSLSDEDEGTTGPQGGAQEDWEPQPPAPSKGGQEIGPDSAEGSDRGAIPDWLASLSDTPPTPSLEPEADEPGTELPGDGSPAWLEELTGPDETIELAGAAPSDQEIPDWLGDLGVGTKPEGHSETSQSLPEPENEEPAASPPAWLEELTGSEETVEIPGAALPAPDIPDWLDEIGAALEGEALPGAPEAGPEPESEEPFAGPPAWLDELAEFDEVEAGAAESGLEEEIPGWLGELGVTSRGEVPSEAPQSLPEPENEEPAAGPPAWLDELAEFDEAEAGEAEPAPADEIPDWLGELGVTSRSEEPSEAPQAGSESEEPDAGSPAWLDEQAKPGDIEIAPEDEISDWLGESGSGTGHETPSEPFTAAAGPATWMDEPAETEPAPSEEIPDWLGKPGAPSGIELPAEPTEAEPGPPAPPSWLEELAEFDQAEVKEPEPAPAEEIPDWLGKPGAPSGIELPAEPTEAEPGPPAPPSWLEELAEFDQAEAEEPEAAPAEEIPDWLSAPGAASEFEQPSETPEAGQEDPAPPSGPPSWMEDLGSLPGDDLPEETQTAGPEDTIEVPPGSLASARALDWLEDIGQDESDALPADSVPGWIAQLANQEPDPRDRPDPDVPQEDVVPDWLEALEREAAEKAAMEEAGLDTDDEGQIPDWVAGLSASASATTEEEDIPAELSPPSWLVELERQTPPVYGEVKQGQSQKGEDLPTWLSEPVADDSGDDIAAQAGDSADMPAWMEAIESEGPAPGEGVPEWLSGMAAAQEAAEQEEPGSPEDESWEELPDWMEDLGEMPTSLPEEAFPQPTGQAEEESQDPEWLAGFEEPEELDSSPGDLGDQLPEWLSTLASNPDQPAMADPDQPPAWMDDSGEFLEGLPAGQRTEAESEESDLETDSVPGWVSSLQSQITDPQQTAGEAEQTEWDLDLPEEDDFGDDEALEWLPEQGRGAGLDLIPASPEMEESLALGEIPDWLSAMRPDEISTRPAAQESAEEAERYGPLAGMRGLLSAEPAIGQAGKPQAYSVKLRISDVQQSSTEALRAMVDAETEPQPARRRRVLSEQRLLRWIIVSVLLLTVVFPYFLDLPLSGLPQMPPPMWNLGRMINDLPENAPVLVVFDFEPGMSGEMNAAAHAVMDHLMLRETPLALVSSSPLGPALGQRLVDRQLLEHGYRYGTDYVNLGYIPGGATGLQNFANFPHASLPLGYDGEPFWRLLDIAAINPWNQPPVRSVGTLADFGMTMLITDNPDTARNWIEQVQPVLKPGSFVIIASGQAAPLIQPYFNSGEGQVAALVPGVAGGASYEGFLTREGLGRSLWDSLGIGALAAIVLLFGAGSFNLFLYYRELESERRERR